MITGVTLPVTVTSVQGHIFLWKHVGFNSSKLLQRVGNVGERLYLGVELPF